MKISDLKPNPQNPRKISDEKLKMLQASIAEFGDLSGFVYNKKSGKMVGGHQRKKVIPKDSKIVIETKYKKPTKTGTVSEGYVEVEGERHKYREVLWDNVREKAANIAANQHGGEWDFQILPEWILDIDENNFPLGVLGFDEKEMDDIMAPVGGLKGGLTDDDAVPEKPKETYVKLGDLYQLGNHRLLCGDSTDLKQVERLMNGEKASVWASDPPYGINHVEVANEKGQAKGYSKISNDDLKDDELKDFIFKSISASLPHMKQNFAFYMWHAMKMQAYFSQAAAAAAGILFHRQIIWVKPNFVFGRGQYHWRHELCLMGWLQGNEPPFYGEQNQSTVWEIGKENDKIHPTQKPVALWEPAILNHTKSGEIIYEPFLGSGSTLIACEKTDRKCYALEIDPHYVQVIIERWEKYTGNKAKKI